MLSELIRALRDDGVNAMASQPATNPGIAVSLVTGQPMGTTATPDAHGVHQVFELGTLVALSGGDFGGQGQASAVSNQVHFAAESASRAAQTVVGGLSGPPFLPAPAAARDARTEEPSTHQRSQSILPSWSSRSCNRSRMRSNRPSCCQRWKRSYTVCHGPYRSGRSRQGAPVRRTQKMPFRIGRWSFHWPPRLPFSGSKSWSNRHCSSDNSSRRIRVTSQDGPGFMPGLYPGYRQSMDSSDRT